MARGRGQMASDYRAPCSLIADSQGGADHSGPVIHHAQADAIAFAVHFWESRAVVPDGQAERVGLEGEADRDALSLAVLDRVVDGFLGDAVEMQGRVVVRNAGVGVALDRAGDAKQLLCGA